MRIPVFILGCLLLVAACRSGDHEAERVVAEIKQGTSYEQLVALLAAEKIQYTVEPLDERVTDIPSTEPAPVAGVFRRVTFFVNEPPDNGVERRVRISVDLDKQLKVVAVSRTGFNSAP